MKLSKSTIEVLKNFASFTEMILIKPGNVITAMSPSNKLLGQATVLETFEVPIPIYELSQFINLVTMFEDPNLEFGERHVTIREGKTHIDYTYASMEAMKRVPDRIAEQKPLETFVIKANQLKVLKKSLGVMALPHVVFKANGKSFEIVGKDQERNSANHYHLEVGDTEHSFELTLETEQLRTLDFDYKISVSNKAIQFSAILEPNNDIEKLDYIMPLIVKHSTING